MTTALSSAAAQFPFDIIPTLLQGLATLSTQYTQLMGQLINAIFGPTGATTYQNLFVTAANVTKFSTWANDAMSAPNLGMTEFKVFWQPPPAPEIPKSSLGAGLGLRSGLSAGLAHAASAGLGQANLVGDLSVPPSWASATPAVRLVANTLPATSLAAAPATQIPANLLGQMALGSMTGGALGAAAPAIYTGSGARARANGERPALSRSSWRLSSRSYKSNRTQCDTGMSIRPILMACWIDCRNSPASTRYTCRTATNPRLPCPILSWVHTERDSKSTLILEVITG